MTQEVRDISNIVKRINSVLIKMVKESSFQYFARQILLLSN